VFPLRGRKGDTLRGRCTPNPDRTVARATIGRPGRNPTSSRNSRGDVRVVSLPGSILPGKLVETEQILRDFGLIVGAGLISQAIAALLRLPEMVVLVAVGP
jgi:hypothetical protein